MPARAAHARAHERYGETYDQESQRLASTESWQRIEKKDRDDILQRLHIEMAPTEATGTEQEVLDTPGSRLSRWLAHAYIGPPQLFAHARAAADKLVEPEIRHIKLDGATLRTPEDVAAWIDRTKQDLLNQVKQVPSRSGEE